MSMNYKQFAKFTKDVERLNKQQKEAFMEACCKELAARLLQKVIEGTIVRTGTLRRGWTTSATGDESRDTKQALYDSLFGKKQNASAYAKSIEIKKVGNTYCVDIVNPVTYASYYEYGHRTPDHEGWVEGHFTLTIAEAELNAASDAILAKKLRKYMKEVFGE